MEIKDEELVKKNRKKILGNIPCWSVWRTYNADRK